MKNLKRILAIFLCIVIIVSTVIFLVYNSNSKTSTVTLTATGKSYTNEVLFRGYYKTVYYQEFNAVDNASGKNYTFSIWRDQPDQLPKIGDTVKIQITPDGFVSEKDHKNLYMIAMGITGLLILLIMIASKIVGKQNDI